MTGPRSIQVMLKSTAPLVVLGLVGGYATAAGTGNRPLGGAVLFAAGALAARGWTKNLGALPAVGLGVTYLGAFAASHPLAKEVGAWPSVGIVTAAAAGAVVAVEATAGRRTSAG